MIAIGLILVVFSRNASADTGGIFDPSKVTVKQQPASPSSTLVLQSGFSPDPNDAHPVAPAAVGGRSVDARLLDFARHYDAATDNQIGALACLLAAPVAQIILLKGGGN